MSDGMTTTVRTLADADAEIADLKHQITTLDEELGAWEQAGVEDVAVADEIKTLREFIADVQRGIRDLSEYEDVCGP